MHFIQHFLITLLLCLISLLNYGRLLQPAESSTQLFNEKLAFADGESWKTVVIQVHTFLNLLVIDYNATQSITMRASFCKDRVGLAIGQGQAFTKTLTPDDLFDLRQSTKCKYDTDPFYEEAENVNKSLYLTLVNNGARSLSNADLRVSTSAAKTRQYRQLLPSTSLPKIDSFNLSKNEEKIIRLEASDLDQLSSLQIALDKQYDNSSIGVYALGCPDKANEKHVANVSIDNSPYLLQINQTELSDNCTPNATTISLRIVSWSEQASGELAYKDLNDSVVMNSDKSRKQNVAHTVLNETIENLGANQARTLIGWVVNINNNLEFHMNITMGSFAILAGFCATKEAPIGSFDVGEWQETIGVERLRTIFNKTSCANSEQHTRKRRLISDVKDVNDAHSRHKFHVTLIGKSPINSGKFLVLNDVRVIPDPDSSSNQYFFARLGNWLYVAYGVIALFLIATIIFMFFFLRQFFGGRRGVNDFTTINAYNNTPGAKVEETTSRTWI